MATTPGVDQFGLEVDVIGGCGHVGLPLAIAFASRGARVGIYDVSEAAVATVNAGQLPFDEPGAAEVLALRRFRPPQVAQVRLLQSVPAHIATAIVTGNVSAYGGPWRSSGDWWKRDPWDHAEWDIAVASGGLYRIHEDLRTGRWFLEGNYD